MTTVNALEIRNRLGGVLDRLEETGEPILVSKGRRIRAVLITPEDFQRRFLDRQTQERRRELLEKIHSYRDHAQGERSSLDVLRELRGYDR